MSEQSVINPVILAAKLAAVANFTAPKVREQIKAHPRLPELLWFIQAMSMSPGGLDKFCGDFLQEFSSRLGTPAMRSAAPGPGPYNAKDRSAIIAQIPRAGWSGADKADDMVQASFWDQADPGGILYPVTPAEAKKAEAFLARLNREYFLKLCRNYAALHLAPYLERICHEAQTAFEPVWYFHDLLGALLEMLDIHAQREAAALAMTEVSLKIFDAMEYSWTEKAAVFIFGDSRFGKTQSVRTRCAMWPGKFRLVTIPCSNSDADLFLAVAKSLGLEVSHNAPRREIKAAIEYVIGFGGLGFVLDEFHFAFPARFSTNTPPMRLNWIRTEIVDKNCPLVMVSTPQEFDRCKSKFVKATSHKIEQFLGRTMLNIALPNELEQADLLAVAKIHFPDLEDDFLQVIVGTAMRAESYLMAVEAIAKRVRYIARRDNHSTVTLADLKLAISEILPAAPALRPAPEKPAAIDRQAQHPLAIAKPIQRARKPAPLALSAPKRETTPTLTPA